MARLDLVKSLPLGTLIERGVIIVGLIINKVGTYICRNTQGIEGCQYSFSREIFVCKLGHK